MQRSYLPCDIKLLRGGKVCVRRIRAAVVEAVDTLEVAIRRQIERNHCGGRAVTHNAQVFKQVVSHAAHPFRYGKIFISAVYIAGSGCCLIIYTPEQANSYINRMLN